MFGQTKTTIQKNKITKKLILFLFAFIIIFTPMAISDIKSTAADNSISDLQKQIKEKNASKNASANKKKEYANKIAELKNQQSDAMKEKKIYDDMINTIESEIKDTEELIGYYKEMIAQEEDEIANAQEEYDRSYDLFLDMIKLSYEWGGEVNYLGMLLDSKNFTEFLQKIDIIASMIEYTENVIADLQKYKDNLELITKNHEEALNQLDDYIKELSESSAEVDGWRAKAEDFITKTSRDIAENERLQFEMDSAVTSMEAEIKRLSAELKAKEDSLKVYVGGSLLWPLDKQFNQVTSNFGPRKSPITGKPEHHNSIDIRAPYGSNIYSANDGTVILACYSAGYGNTIVVDHGGGRTTRYSHASSLLKKAGDKVKKGDVIAKIGSTGWSTGNHLDFGYMEDGVPKDPLSGGRLARP